MTDRPLTPAEQAALVAVREKPVTRLRVYPHKPPQGEYTFVIVTNKHKLMRDLEKFGIYEMWVWTNQYGVLCAAYQKG